jgi:hypothetical protein
MPNKPGIYLRGGTRASFDEDGNEIGDREIVYATDTGEIGTYKGWFNPYVKSDPLAVAFLETKDSFNLSSDDATHYITSYRTDGWCIGGNFDALSGVFTAQEPGVYMFFVSLSLDGVGTDDSFYWHYHLNDVKYVDFLMSPVNSSGREYSNTFPIQVKMNDGDTMRFAYSGMSHSPSVTRFRFMGHRVGAF